MKTIFAFAAIAAAVSFSLPATAADGLNAIKSQYSAKETMDRLEKIVTQKGMNVFARIDHASGAATIGKTMRPTEVLIFGSPKGGTPLMECAQTAAIDLPMKALVWTDASGQVWLGHNDPAYIAQRHDAGKCPVIEGLTTTLRALASETVAQ